MKTLQIDDRYQAHQQIALMEQQNGSKIQWRMREGTVEYTDDNQGVFENGDIVMFDIDLVTRLSKGGKKSYIITSTERQDWWGRKSLSMIGVRTVKVVVSNIMAPINRQGQTFHKPAARFLGIGVVENSEQTNLALANGVGTAKTFGFGLLSMEKINDQ